MYSTQNAVRDEPSLNERALNEKPLNENHRVDSRSSSAWLNSLRQEAIGTLYTTSPNLQGNNPLPMRQQLREYFIATFERYESLFATLASDEAYYKKSIELRHPLIFYFGHTATFFVNKMLLTHLIDERIDPHLESLFAVGVDEMGWDDLNIAEYQWPSVDEVKAYRHKVSSMVISVIETAPLQLPIDWNNPWWAIIMGIEHENIHLETSSVLIRQHNIKYVKNKSAWAPCRISENAPQNELLSVPAGTVILGKEKSNPFYGWDNEYGQYSAEVKEFQSSKYLVSNQEFLAFVQAGGYKNSQWWEQEGKAWLTFTGSQHPTFWLEKSHRWCLRLMTEEIAMPWDWPAEVNYHEAKAFCNWKKQVTGLSVRLPTENEWYRLCDHTHANSQNLPAINANQQLNYFASSCPVSSFAQGEFYDVVGNVWQWTETPMYPFEGFDVHPIYDDFTTPTFDERHNLMKGGSWISFGNEILRESRYAFRRHFFQHAGFRYVVSEDIKPMQSSHYETDKLLSEYAEFHYGDDYFGVPNFSKSLVEKAISILGDAPKQRALDLGCASGRATFELAQYFDSVTGIDFSARFVGQGVQLAEGGSLRYTLADDGELVQYKARSLKDINLNHVKYKVEFFQGDACNLKEPLKGYDFILAANLIDRLYSPAKFLNAIHERLNVGGVLLISSPYTWLTDHTPRTEWIGGFKKDGESFTTFDGLKAHLSSHFELVQAPIEVPFVIRETKRKFQHTLSEVTFWKRVK
jgi:5-histidylcysteine sulfoxide synthase/putative 4-mercaptohistidine N1-methyltranferase